MVHNEAYKPFNFVIKYMSMTKKYAKLLVAAMMLSGAAMAQADVRRPAPDAHQEDAIPLKMAALG